MSASFLPGTRIEVINTALQRRRPRAVLFDFDGTLSLIREGWPEVMIPMMVEHLANTGTAETREQLTSHVEEFVMRLNGKQTIYQMMQLADEVRARGGVPHEPLEYKRQYHDLLWQRVSGRVAGLASRTLDAETLTVPGSQQLLSRLQVLGVPLYLASGTDVAYVKNELSALGLAPYFGERVWGALDDYQNFSKKMVVERLVRENQLDQGGLVGFGDGYVEIEEVKRAGGIAIGVASDEQHRTGINEWKRQRLIRAGADVIVPDYRDLDALLEFLALSGS